MSKIDKNALDAFITKTTTTENFNNKNHNHNLLEKINVLKKLCLQKTCNQQFKLINNLNSCNNNSKNIRYHKNVNRYHSYYLRDQHQQQQHQDLQHSNFNLLPKNNNNNNCNKIVGGSDSVKSDGAKSIINETTHENIVSIDDTTNATSSKTSSSSSSLTNDLYFWYGDSLAYSGRLYEAFDIYAHISNQLDDIIPIERLKHLSINLINRFAINKNYINISDSYFLNLAMANTNLNNNNNLNLISAQYNLNNSSFLHQQQQQRVPNQTLFMDYEIQQNQQQHQQHKLQKSQQQQQQQTIQQKYLKIDPLLCPFCEDILMCPVTAPCGHTFCSQCCSSASQCILCGFKLISINSNNNNMENIHDSGSNSDLILNLKQDVLIKRLIDKWWPHELEARKLNEEAMQCLDMNSLDEALKYCNESLEKSPNNYKSLLLRSEVLYRLNHFQSSLADADNALKSHPTSSKAHHRRALALIGLNKNEEALISQCLAVSFDINSTCISSSTFKNEVCRLLQRFLLPSKKELNSTKISSKLSSSSPYSVAMKKRRKNRKKLIQISKHPGTSDCDEGNSSCGEDDSFVHETNNRKRRNLSSDNYMIPRSSMRLRTLLDRIQQEVLKMKRIEHKPNFLQINPNQVDISDFDCVLCCRTLWKPVITPCGHTYCWVCLDRCMDYSSSCPLCMSPLVEQPMYRQCYRGGSSTPIPFSLAKKSVTKFLEIAMQRFIPDWYEKRRRQEIESEPSVPVFICTTAFPNVPCPLFVYEPRYRLMVRRAIESGDRQFGIVQPHTGRSRYSDIGTMLDIRDCVLLGDGCSILSTIGCRRFKILSRDEKDGYETAKVEYIYDEPISDEFIPIINEMHSNVLRKARKWFESLSSDIKEEILRSFGPMPIPEDNWESIADGPAWAWWIIAILPLNQQLKVNILATTSLEKRLRAIGKTLDYITGRIRKSSQQNCVVVQCEGLPTCQAIECCQQTTQSATESNENHHQHHHHHHPDVNSQTEYML